MKVLRDITTRHMNKKVGEILTKKEMDAYKMSLDFYVRNGFLEKEKPTRKKVK